MPSQFRTLQSKKNCWWAAINRTFSTGFVNVKFTYKNPRCWPSNFQQVLKMLSCCLGKYKIGNLYKFYIYKKSHHQEQSTQSVLTIVLISFVLRLRFCQKQMNIFLTNYINWWWIIYFKSGFSLWSLNQNTLKHDKASTPICDVMWFWKQ